MAANRRENMPLSRRSVLTAGGAALAAVFGLSGCAQDDALAKQAKAGDNKNYVAGDGSVTEFAVADRKSPVALKGTLFDGTAVTSAIWPSRMTQKSAWSMSSVRPSRSPRAP